MEELYLKTKSGKQPIEAAAAEKYHLEPGDLSPFTRERIVDRNGKKGKPADADEDSEASIRQDFDNMPLKGITGDGVDQMENGFEFSQSEIIDFSQGVDSRMDENK